MHGYRRQRPYNTGRLLQHSILLPGCMLFCLLGVFLTTIQAHAQGVPGGNIANPVVRAVDLAKPAVVRIITTIGGRLTVHFNDMDSASFPQNGSTYKLQLSGSGTFITAQGDILTADHVVTPPHDQALDQYLYQVAAQDITNYISTHFNGAPPTSKDDVIGALSGGLFRSETHYSQASSEAFLSTDYAGKINATSLDTVPSTLHAPVDRIEAESKFAERDMAIIHVKMNDTPGIPLGDSSNVEQQDDLTIIGFPGNGDISEKKMPTTVLTSSVNRVYVSSLKQTDEGASVIQVGGNVEQGDSGGPALDSRGNIVGIVSFGLFTSDGSGNTSFLQASNTARSMAASLKLDTTPGTLTRAWRSAFTSYSATTAGHWHAAQHDFQQMLARYHNFQAGALFLDYASSRARHEAMPQSGNNGSSILLLTALLLIILSAGIILFLLLFRKPQASSFLNSTATILRSKGAALAGGVGAAQSQTPSSYKLPVVTGARFDSVSATPPQESISPDGAEPSLQTPQSQPPMNTPVPYATLGSDYTPVLSTTNPYLHSFSEEAMQASSATPGLQPPPPVMPSVPAQGTTSAALPEQAMITEAWASHVENRATEAESSPAAAMLDQHTVASEEVPAASEIPVAPDASSDSTGHDAEEEEEEDAECATDKRASVRKSTDE